jgi:hypothetical protein
MTLYQTVLLKMLDIISIRKTSPRAHTVWMWLMTFFLSWTCFRTVPLLGKSSRLVHLSHLVSFCISAIASGTVIGIHRTFNLSSCFLTPLCFPNVNLENKRTSMPPVMLGPMLLHWDGNMDSYHLPHSQKWWVLCSFAYLRWRRRDVCNFHMIYIDDIIHSCMCVIFWTW